jgi:hypothetical protein
MTANVEKNPDDGTDAGSSICLVAVQSVVTLLHSSTFFSTFAATAP